MGIKNYCLFILQDVELLQRTLTVLSRLKSNRVFVKTIKTEELCFCWIQIHLFSHNHISGTGGTSSKCGQFLGLVSNVTLSYKLALTSTIHQYMGHKHQTEKDTKLGIENFFSIFIIVHSYQLSTCLIRWIIMLKLQIMRIADWFSNLKSVVSISLKHTKDNSS